MYIGAAEEELVVADWLDRNAIIDVMTACSAGVEPSYYSDEVRLPSRSGQCLPQDLEHLMP